MPDQSVDVRVTVTADGTELTTKAFFDSTYNRTRVRIDGDQLRTAYERGYLELTVEVAPLQPGEYL